MANRRSQIVDALVDLVKTNFNGVNYDTDLYGNVSKRQIFWDEVPDWPYICIYAGGETREYLPGGFKWAFLTVNMRIYVNDEDAKTELENIFQDLEALLDSNNDLTVDSNDLTTDIRIISIEDDEGLLNPYGVGEMTLEIRYEV